MLDAQGIDVDDTAANAELADAVYHRHTLEADVNEMRVHPVEAMLLTDPAMKGAQLEGVRWDEGRDQGRSRSHDDGGVAAGELGRRLDPQPGDLLGRRPTFIHVHIPGGEIAHDLIAGDGLQIVAPLFGAVFIGGDDEQGPGDGALNLRKQKGGKGRGQGVQQHLPLPTVQAGDDVSETRRRGRLAGDVIERRSGHCGSSRLKLKSWEGRAVAWGNQPKITGVEQGCQNTTAPAVKMRQLSKREQPFVRQAYSTRRRFAGFFFFAV